VVEVLLELVVLLLVVVLEMVGFLIILHLDLRDKELMVPLLVLQQTVLNMAVGAVLG
jgi:hypothetical protein